MADEQRILNLSEQEREDGIRYRRVVFFTSSFFAVWLFLGFAHYAFTFLNKAIASGVQGASFASYWPVAVVLALMVSLVIASLSIAAKVSMFNDSAGKPGEENGSSYASELSATTASTVVKQVVNSD